MTTEEKDEDIKVLSREEYLTLGKKLAEGVPMTIHNQKRFVLTFEITQDKLVSIIERQKNLLITITKIWGLHGKLDIPVAALNAVKPDDLLIVEEHGPDVRLSVKPPVPPSSIVLPGNFNPRK